MNKWPSEEWPHTHVDPGLVSYQDPEIKREKVTANVIQTTKPNATHPLFLNMDKAPKSSGMVSHLKIPLQQTLNGLAMPEETKHLTSLQKKSLFQDSLFTDN